jgi:hypothetical protein
VLCSIINYKTCQLIDIWVVIFSGLVYFSNLPDMKLNDIIMEFWSWLQEYTLLIVPTKNERDPPLFIGKLLIKFQNILRNTIQVIIRHSVKIYIFLYPPHLSCSGVYWFHHVCPSCHPSVHLSFRPSVDKSYVVR